MPSNNDGEVDEFCLVPASQLVEKICDPQMKTTSCPVTLDFLIRKGILTHDAGIYIYIICLSKKSVIETWRFIFFMPNLF